jgi:uncharacterized membrane protein
VLALLGTLSIDAKRRRKLGGGWTDFASKTSNVPFGAILSGRTSFSAKEYFDWRFLLALIVFIALLFAHAALFGMSAFPGGCLNPYSRFYENIARASVSTRRRL